MADNTVHDTIPCPPPVDDDAQRLEHLVELLEHYSKVRTGELTGDPTYTTLDGQRIRLQEAA
jgi:hypothetical protein